VVSEGNDDDSDGNNNDDDDSDGNNNDDDDKIYNEGV